MRKYEKIRESLNNNEIALNEPIALERIERILGIDRLPESYYNSNRYWNNSKYAIGKILNELGLKAKLKQATVEFEEIERDENNEK